MGDNWFYVRNGQQAGPVPLQSLVMLAKTGQVGAADLVWTEGMNQWQAADSVPQLQNVFAANVPQPVPIAYQGPKMEPGQGMLNYAAAVDLVYAGFWLRLVAWVIDVVIMGIIFGGCMAAVFFTAFTQVKTAASGGTMPQSAGVALLAGLALGMLAVWLVMVIGIWLYYAFMESSQWQGTLGKMAIGLRVTDMAGERISFGRATGRFWAKMIPAVAGGCIGGVLGRGGANIIPSIVHIAWYVTIAFTERKQAPHDMIASTLVCRRA